MEHIAKNSGGNVILEGRGNFSDFPMGIAQRNCGCPSLGIFKAMLDTAQSCLPDLVEGPFQCKPLQDFVTSPKCRSSSFLHQEDTK